MSSVTVDGEEVVCGAEGLRTFSKCAPHLAVTARFSLFALAFYCAVRNMTSHRAVSATRRRGAVKCRQAFATQIDPQALSRITTGQTRGPKYAVGRLSWLDATEEELYRKGLDANERDLFGRVMPVTAFADRNSRAVIRPVRQNQVEGSMKASALRSKDRETMSGLFERLQEGGDFGRPVLG